MSQAAPPDPAPPPIWSRRVLVPLAAGAAALLAACLVLGFAFPVPLTLEEAEGPLDMVGLYVWVIAAPLALLATAVARTRADRLTTLWLAVVGVLAALRELDMHHRIRPERIGEWGMRFRADWWLDPGVPVGPKIVWGLVAAVVAAALLAPLLAAKIPVFRLLHAGDTPGWLLAVGIGLLASGYVMDDLMRHSPHITKTARWRVEETCETLGSAAYLASVACTLRWPLTGRIAALTLRR